LGSYAEILLNIEGFLKRYYTRKLLHQIIVFTSIESLVLFLIGTFENWIWLPSQGRLVLLLFLILQLIILSYFLIISVLLVIYKVIPGLSYWEASRMIGRLLPNIQDRLTNLIELAANPHKTELINAGIAQRAEQLNKITFKKAIIFEPLKRSGRLLIIPFLLILVVLLSGFASDYAAALYRIVRFNNQFVKPAPFEFILLENTGYVFENQSFNVKVNTVGTYRPQPVYLNFDGKQILMEDHKTHYETTLEQPLKSAEYFFEANGFRSVNYALKVLPLPRINNLKLTVKYPRYLKQKDITIEGSGNAEVPEGSRVYWNIATQNTTKIEFSESDTTALLVPKSENNFGTERIIFQPLLYTLSTTNSHITNFEKLSYKINTVADQAPVISVNLEAVDESTNLYYFVGALSDDYGLSELTAVLTPINSPTKSQKISLGSFDSNIASFSYNFPSGFTYDEKETYTLQFLIRDNDGLRSGKTSESQSFSINFKDQNERTLTRLESQKKLLNNLEETSRTRKQLSKDWNNQLTKNREIKSLNYQDQRAVKALLERQEQQERLMQSFTKEINETLSETPSDTPDKALLQERLLRLELEAQKNADLLEELQELMQKLNQETLKEELEQFSKKQNENNRSLSQILELTKKYYVSQTARTLSSMLEQQATKQEQLADSLSNSKPIAQDSLNREFNAMQNLLQDLARQNSALKKPINWKRDIEKEESVKSNQSRALEQLQNQPNEANQRLTNPAKQSQSAAARKLKSLSDDLNNSLSAASSASERAESAATLRQILENLILFSLEEEQLLAHSNEQLELRSGQLIKQQDLRRLFEHVDDSLFSLSLRQPEVSETINKNITEVYYNLEESLKQMANNQWDRSASYQQYTIAASNTLASLLVNILENLQESLKPGAGKGKGSDLQLPDVIQSQTDLQDNISKQLGKGRRSSEQEENNANNSEKSGNSNTSDGPSEDGMDFNERFQIYQEQAKVKAQLEAQINALNTESERNKAKAILKEMEEVENNVLSGNMDQNLMNRLNRITAELLDLEKAILKQGQGETRKSNVNANLFINPIEKTQSERNENQSKGVEILNRQTLPLRGIYKNKAKEYFKKDDNIPL
jgi:hypothetical protein